MGSLPAHAGEVPGHSHGLRAQPQGTAGTRQQGGLVPSTLQVTASCFKPAGVIPHSGQTNTKHQPSATPLCPQTSQRCQTHKQGQPLASPCLFCPSFQLFPSDRSLMSPRMSPLTQGQCRIIQVLALLPPGSSPPCPSARSTRPGGNAVPRNPRNPTSCFVPGLTLSWDGLQWDLCAVPLLLSQRKKKKMHQWRGAAEDTEYFWGGLTAWNHEEAAAPSLLTPLNSC